MVFAGSVSDNATVVAAAAVRFVTAIVYVRFEPATTGSGESTFVTDRSAGAANAGTAGSTSNPVTRATGKIHAYR